MIRTYDQLIANTATLEKLRRKAVDKENAFYKNLVGQGRVYVPYLVGDELRFGPSRFLGYRGNTERTHKSKLFRRDGRKTNIKIEKVLSDVAGYKLERRSDDRLLAYFRNYCDALDIKPTEHTRKFWLTPEIEAWLESRSSDPGYRRMRAVIAQHDDGDGTTRRAMINARVGQGRFRQDVLEKYDACLVTGLDERELLIASHIKPWSDCSEKPVECIDPNNALLLSPAWDKLFDRGFVSFADDGTLLVSKRLTERARSALSISRTTKIAVTPEQAAYLAHHRELYGF